MARETAETHSVTITASDGVTGGTASDTFDLTINSVYSKPAVKTEIPNQSVDNGAAFSADFSTYFEDTDGDPLTFTATGLPTGVTLNSDGTLSFTASLEERETEETYTVTITASDGVTGGTASDTFDLTINSMYTTPTVTEIPNQSVDNGAAFSADFSTYFEDTDGDTLTFTATGLPTGVTLNTNGTLSFTAALVARETAETHSVTITASDGVTGGTASDTFDLTINSVYTEPEVVKSDAISIFDGHEVTADTPLDLSDYFTDDDGDTLEFSATSLPTGFSLNDDGELTGKIDLTDPVVAQSYTFTLTADDNLNTASTSVDLHIALNVEAVDVAPFADATVTGGDGDDAVDLGPNIGRGEYIVTVNLGDGDNQFTSGEETVGDRLGKFVYTGGAGKDELTFGANPAQGCKTTMTLNVGDGTNSATFGVYAGGYKTQLLKYEGGTGTDTLSFGDGVAFNNGNVTIDLGADTSEDTVTFAGSIADGGDASKQNGKVQIINFNPEDDDLDLPGVGSDYDCTTTGGVATITSKAGNPGGYHVSLEVTSTAALTASDII